VGQGELLSCPFFLGVVKHILVREQEQFDKICIISLAKDKI